MNELPSKRCLEFENMDPPPEYSTVVKTETFPECEDFGDLPPVYYPTTSTVNSTNANVGFNDFGNPRAGLIQIGEDFEACSTLTIPEKHRFMRNVFGLLLIEAGIITGIAALFVYEPTVHQGILDVDKGTDDSPGSAYMGISAFVVYILAATLSFGAFKFREMMISCPRNFIALGVLTLLFGYTVGILAALDPLQNPSVIPYIGGTFGIVCLALVIFTFQAKQDLTFPITGIIYILIILLTIVGSLYGIVSKNVFPEYILGGPLYVALGLSIYAYVIVRIMLMGDWSKIAMSPEEYVLASVIVYFGIVWTTLIFVLLIGVVFLMVGGRSFICFYRRREPEPVTVYVIQRPEQMV